MEDIRVYLLINLYHRQNAFIETPLWQLPFILGINSSLCNCFNVQYSTITSIAFISLILLTHNNIQSQLIVSHHTEYSQNLSLREIIRKFWNKFCKHKNSICPIDSDICHRCVCALASTIGADIKIKVFVAREKGEVVSIVKLFSNLRDNLG